MDANLIIALITASALLVAIPGPNVALIIANTIGYGFRYGAVTVFGTTIGIALQLVIVILGLAVLLEFAATAFIWLKWAGVAYLLYLGISAWRQGIDEIDEGPASKKSFKAIFWQGLLLAIINPKTLIFNAAFLPQFVVPGSGPQALVIIGMIYLGVMFIGDLIWAATAQSARPLVLKIGRLRHRLTGGLFICSGLGLAMSRIER